MEHPAPVRRRSELTATALLLAAIALASGGAFYAREHRRQLNHRLAALLSFDASESTPTEIRALVRSGADVNVAGEGGQTSLMVVARWGEPRLLDELLQRGARVNERDGQDFTALMNAAIGNRGANIRLLALHGAHLDLCESRQFTALMLAARDESAEAVRALLECGADASLRVGGAGPTALEYAQWTQHLPTIQALREHLEAKRRTLKKSAAAGLVTHGGDRSRYRMPKSSTSGRRRPPTSE